MNPPLKSLEMVEEESEMPEVEMCQKLTAELSVRSSSHGNLVNGHYMVLFHLKWHSLGEDRSKVISLFFLADTRTFEALDISKNR